MNPAVTGIESFKDARLGYRKQWMGFEGAPKTAYFSFHTPVGSKLPFVGNLGANDEERYPEAEKHHGLGFNIVSDKAGIFSRTDFNASYAYHLPLTSKINLSLGFAWGFAQVTLDQQEAGEESVNDPALGNLENRQIKPTFSPGVYFYSKSFFVGFSAAELLLQKLRSGGTQSGFEARLYPHYFAISGLRLLLRENQTLLFTSVITRVKANTVLELNMRSMFSNRIWAGAGYRHGESISALAGFNVNSLMNISYSYDFNTTAINKVSNGSHEIVLGLKLGNTYKLFNPQYLL